MNKKIFEDLGYWFSSKNYGKFEQSDLSSLSISDSYQKRIGAVARATGRSLYKTNSLLSIFDKMEQRRLNFVVNEE